MSDAESFEPLIRNILTGPGVDLSTVSAKRVRKQLLALAPSLTEESLKAIKDDVDAVITRVYSEVKEQADESEHVDEDQEEEEEEAEQPPKKKAKKDRPSSDEVYAQKLAQELNGHSTRKSKSSSSTPRKGTSKSAKSAATIDSDDEAEGSKPTKKRKRVKKEKEPGDPSAPAKGGFAKEYNLSEPLADVLSVSKLSRPQVVKQLWVYIKGNTLQNPENKREILCDDKLRLVFNVDKIDMFKMNKVLGDHLTAPEEAS
ncbi:SWIB/MDM2 domain-containing protein [Pterulicium gracile]|uniref:SWIB/MDM2 domain-containing protein n=1 Tax=Pterulicium gracile TaxID=1884261 RepID=A0A5C3R384_9AGAR|nr:SWIB/MDM2 domain-containing protein [Pterula gracilis]